MRESRPPEVFVRSSGRLKETPRLEQSPEAGETPKGLFEVAYEKALHAETDQISMEGFERVYGVSVVERDRQQLAERKKKFASREDAKDERVHRLAKILEVVVTEQIELSNWFGEGVITQQSSEYDDVFRRTDTIVRFPSNGEDQYPPLLVDFTVASGEHLLSKLARNMEDAWMGQLGNVKYYHTPDKKEKGKMSMCPSVVLAVSQPRLYDVARLWVQGKQPALASHPIRALLLHEIRIQLEAQIQMAEQFKQERAKEVLAESFAWVKEMIERDHLEVPKDASAGKKLDTSFLQITQMLKESFGYQPTHPVVAEEFPIIKFKDKDLGQAEIKQLENALFLRGEFADAETPERSKLNNLVVQELARRSKAGDKEARETLQRYQAENEQRALAQEGFVEKYKEPFSECSIEWLDRALNNKGEFATLPPREQRWLRDKVLTELGIRARLGDEEAKQIRDAYQRSRLKAKTKQPPV